MEPSNEIEPIDDRVARARGEFHSALVASLHERSKVGDVEAAAARFCRALHAQGRPPERTLIDAKEVIADAIDGDNVIVAERAVLSCIQHYYRS